MPRYLLLGAFGPWLSSHPGDVIKKQNSQMSDCSPANRERELGLDRRETSFTLLMKGCCNGNSTQY